MNVQCTSHYTIVSSRQRDREKKEGDRKGVKKQSETLKGRDTLTYR